MDISSSISSWLTIAVFKHYNMYICGNSSKSLGLFHGPSSRFFFLLFHLDLCTCAHCSDISILLYKNISGGCCHDNKSRYPHVLCTTSSNGEII